MECRCILCGLKFDSSLQLNYHYFNFHKVNYTHPILDSINKKVDDLIKNKRETRESLTRHIPGLIKPARK